MDDGDCCGKQHQSDEHSVEIAMADDAITRSLGFVSLQLAASQRIAVGGHDLPNSI
jgi:hypothetical protein